MDLGRIISLILPLLMNSFACYMTIEDDPRPNYCKMNDSVIPNDIIFKLYPRDSDWCYQVYTNDEGSLRRLCFDVKKPLKIYIHGYWPSSLEQTNRAARNAFVQNSDVNYISVDWRLYAKQDIKVAEANAEVIGQKVGKFIDWLISMGVASTDIHLIGHSMGCHIGAFAARYLKNGRLLYLTACDPANDKFWRHNHQKLNKHDAQYVEVIHTNTHHFGLLLPHGDADFYVNGGSLQPACLDKGNKTDDCSHFLCVSYFIESLNSDCFIGYQCLSHRQYLRKREHCTDKAMMGGRYPKMKARGSYYVDTNNVSPYGKCENSHFL